jgi:hypothetical protein
MSIIILIPVIVVAAVLARIISAFVSYGKFISKAVEAVEIAKINSSRHRIAENNVIHWWHYEFYCKDFNFISRWYVHGKGLVRIGSPLEKSILREYSNLKKRTEKENNARPLTPA